MSWGPAEWVGDQLTGWEGSFQIDMARYTARFWIFENLVIPVIPEIPVIPVIPIMYDKSTISEL